MLKVFLATALLSTAAIPLPLVPPREAPAAAVPAPLERIAVLGASVTDGFLVPREVGAMVTLADTLQAACAAPVPRPFRRSSWFFFRTPQLHGQRYVEAAVAHRPTLVVAVDFLFWFGYGFGLSEERRLALFEEGIALLERLDCPILVGDYPDMSQAVRGVGIFGGPMIGPAHLPEPATRAELNRRLRAWASGRKGVTVLDLSSFVERVKHNQPFELLGNRWEGNLVATLLDKDLLHATFEGEVALTVMIVDSLLRSGLSLSPAAFLTDKETIKRRVLEARAVEIAQRQRRSREAYRQR